ncbi:MAG: hypothetical protein U9O98_07140 [Asgard group archaeon]|nr:hypothetical protein [Asgard group archaeon]
MNPKKDQQKSTETSSIITVRALCNRCNKTDEFQISTKELLPHVGGLYQVSTIHHCPDDKKMIMSIILDRNYSVRQATVSPLVHDMEEDKFLPQQIAELEFLTKKVNQTDEIIHAALCSKQIIVAGDKKEIVKKLVRLIDLFTPTKYTATIEWSTKVEKDKRIIGTKVELTKKYDDKTVIVDLEKNKVFNGKSCPYCQSFIDDLLALEPEVRAYAANLKIEMLVNFARMLIEFSKRAKIGSQALDLIRNDVSQEALDLIEDIVAGFDPTALEIIREDWL